MSYDPEAWREIYRAFKRVRFNIAMAEEDVFCKALNQAAKDHIISLWLADARMYIGRLEELIAKAECEV